MLRLRYILAISALLFLADVSAQKEMRMHLRRGDKLYADSAYDKAQTEYLKALEKDTENSKALYNLGNTYLYQEKGNDAMAQYELAAKSETDKGKLAHIHHNMGVICQASKQYAQAVEYYKQSLRENPNDHETRYNLAVAMRMLQDQQNQQQQQQNQEQEQEQEQEQQEQQQNQEQNQDQQQQNQQDQQQEQQNPEQQENEDEISKENAEQLLESAMQDEKEVQEKVKKMMQIRGKKLDKDW